VTATFALSANGPLIVVATAVALHKIMHLFLGCSGECIRFFEIL